MISSPRSTNADWPQLPFDAWKDTCATLHLWTQVVGKVRLALSPWTNHSWHVPLYVTARGLSTSPVWSGARAFEMEFDFQGQQLVIQTVDGVRRTVGLEPRTVADFYAAVMAELGAIGIDVQIDTLPCEIPDAIPFDQDTTHDQYDGEAARRFWLALVQMDRVFKGFRARFIGKCSPVHFFWGSFDLAVTRFSGRDAPPHPGGVPGLPDWVAVEAYSHEVSSAGFWPGGGGLDYASFYSYAYPPPEGFAGAPVQPEAAGFFEALGEFLLPYDAVQTSNSPDGALMAFLQSTYEAAADAAGWDRAELERDFAAEGH